MQLFTLTTQYSVETLLCKLDRTDLAVSQVANVDGVINEQQSDGRGTVFPRRLSVQQHSASAQLVLFTCIAFYPVKDPMKF